MYSSRGWVNEGPAAQIEISLKCSIRFDQIVASWLSGVCSRSKLCTLETLALLIWRVIRTMVKSVQARTAQKGQLLQRSECKSSSSTYERRDFGGGGSGGASGLIIRSGSIPRAAIARKGNSNASTFVGIHTICKKSQLPPWHFAAAIPSQTFCPGFRSLQDSSL
ncbi:MAG: hypothetical protein RL069_2433 [Planctomycetota bacterium]